LNTVSEIKSCRLKGSPIADLESQCQMFTASDFTIDRWPRKEYSDLKIGNDLNVVTDDEFDEQSQTYRDPDAKADLTIKDATDSVPNY